MATYWRIARVAWREDEGNRMGIVAIGIAMLAASACAKHVPEPAALPSGTPHISWALMYGDSRNAEKETACRSDSNGPCVLPVSRQGAQSFADFHLYFHGAGAETRYEGTKSIGYLDGPAQSHVSKLNMIVSKNESIGNSSTTGIVTSVAGTYTITISLTATIPASGKSTPISESITVAVK